MLCAVADLGAFRLSELAALGAALRRCGAGAGSLESAAQGIVHLLYDELRSADQRSCALVLAALEDDLATQGLDDDVAMLAVRRAKRL